MFFGIEQMVNRSVTFADVHILASFQGLRKVSLGFRYSVSQCKSAAMAEDSVQPVPCGLRVAIAS